MSAKLGQENTNARLTEKQVKAIWKRIQNGETYVGIAGRYKNATPSAVARIGRGETWNQVTGLSKDIKNYRNFPTCSKYKV